MARSVGLWGGVVLVFAGALLWMATRKSAPPADEPIVLQSARGSYFEIRDLLTGADAESWWDDLRGERSPVMVLWVVEADLDSSPPVVKLAPKRGGPAEVTLSLEYLHDWGLRVGEEVRFNGIPDSLTRNPFHLILREGQLWPLRGDVDPASRPTDVSAGWSGAGFES